MLVKVIYIGIIYIIYYNILSFPPFYTLPLISFENNFFMLVASFNGFYYSLHIYMFINDNQHHL